MPLPTGFIFSVPLAAIAVRSRQNLRLVACAYRCKTKKKKVTPNAPIPRRCGPVGFSGLAIMGTTKQSAKIGILKRIRTPF
jgi:hypothetical protein